MQRDDLIKKLMVETSNLSNTDLEALILRAKRLSMHNLEIGTKVRVKHITSLSELVQGYVPGGPDSGHLIEEDMNCLILRMLSQVSPEEVETTIVGKGHTTDGEACYRIKFYHHNFKDALTYYGTDELEVL